VEPHRIGSDELTLEALVKVARRGRPVAIGPEVLERCEAARSCVETALASGKKVYGVNTGFGHLAGVTIPAPQAISLQVNILRSHAAGVGDPLPTDVTRGLLLARVSTLALGHSLVRPATLAAIAALLNAGVTPVVPERGSVGASGDLAPLAHAMLVLIGEGEATLAGRRLAGRTALAGAGLTPHELAAGEGLALINGTQAMTAILALALYDARELLLAAEAAAALSTDTLLATDTHLDPAIHALRLHPGQAVSAATIRAFIGASALVASHRENDPRIQDAYSIRCAPQVHGASRDALTSAEVTVLRELSAVTDNPLVFPERNLIRSGGNFHGQPVALAADQVKVALAEIASISERRLERLVNPALSQELPAFLAREPGVESGLMIAQYTAAALVSENKVLAHPASVDSIPTSANQEDHVSMGTIAARQAARILDNARLVVAAELLAGARALEARRPLTGGPGSEAAAALVTELVGPTASDRPPGPEIERVANAIATGALRERIAAALGVAMPDPPPPTVTISG
jgi:histidine ammonia-lyase